MNIGGGKYSPVVNVVLERVREQHWKSCYLMRTGRKASLKHLCRIRHIHLSCTDKLVLMNIYTHETTTSIKIQNNSASLRVILALLGKILPLFLQMSFIF